MISLFSRSAHETISMKEYERLLGYGRFSGGAQTRAGVPVGPVSSLEVGAHSSCILLIAAMMATIPVELRKKRKSGGSDVMTGNPTHEVVSLLANRETVISMWQISRFINRALWGTSYDVIDKNGIGQVTALWQLMTPSVRPIRIDSNTELTQYDDFSSAGELAYEITRTWPDLVREILPSSRVLRIPYLFSFNGIIGKPPIDCLRLRLGIAKALSAWEADFFGKGFSPAYIGELDGHIPKKNKEEVVKKTQEQFAGFKSNHGLFLPEYGVSVKAEQYRLDWTMLSERERGVVEEICGFWRVHPALIGRNYGTTYSNVQEYNQQFKTYAIGPLIQNDKLHFQAYLLNKEQRRRGMFFNHDFSILDAMDLKSWSENIHRQFQAGAIFPNEIREMRGRNPYEGGDTPFMQSQMETVESRIAASSSGETDQDAETGEAPDNLRVLGEKN